MFSFINIITDHFRTSREKNLASNNFKQWKNQFKIKICCKVFYYHQSLSYVGKTPEMQRRNKKQYHDKKHLEVASFSFMQLSLTLVSFLWKKFFTFFVKKNIQTNVKRKTFHTFGIDKLYLEPFERSIGSKLLIY